MAGMASSKHKGTRQSAFMLYCTFCFMNPLKHHSPKQPKNFLITTFCMSLCSVVSKLISYGYNYIEEKSKLFRVLVTNFKKETSRSYSYALMAKIFYVKRKSDLFLI